MLWQSREDVWAGQPLAILVFNLFFPWAAQLFWQNELFTPGMFGTWLIHSAVPSHAAATVTLWEQCEELSGIPCSRPDIDLWNVRKGICISWSCVTWGLLWCVVFCLQCCGCFLLQGKIEWWKHGKLLAPPRMLQLCLLPVHTIFCGSIFIVKFLSILCRYKKLWRM